MAYGLINVYKPSGPTSHDVVAAVRRGTGERRIGHAGTLDPLADGVLVLALGKATRLIEYLSGARKEYRAEIRLGIATTTYDIEGQITETHEQPQPDLPAVQTALAVFTGEILQKPPIYSAIKVGGKPAYARARAGEDLQLPARPATIYSIDIVSYSYPLLALTVACSAGTYIRSLAHDLGQALGTAAALNSLTRTASGDFRVGNAVSWESLNNSFETGSWEQYLLPADRGVASLQAITLTSAQLADVLHGRAIRSISSPDGKCRAYSPSGELVAILSAGAEPGLWYPHKVLANVHGQDTLSTS